MYELAFTNSFKKSIKRALKSKDSKAIEKRIEIIVELIRLRKIIDRRYKDHALQGGYLGYRECHIKPDVLLLYEVDETAQIITLVRTPNYLVRRDFCPAGESADSHLGCRLSDEIRDIKAEQRGIFVVHSNRCVIF